MPDVSARYVLFPGRHHLVTSFQVAYLTDLLATAGTGRPVRADDGREITLAADAVVVWAVTSATHSGTRRNPLPAHRREALIERVSAAAGLPSLVAPVADVPPSARFATTVLGSVALSTGVHATPQDAVVACSTPAVAAQWRDLGFAVVGVEADVDPAVAPVPARPWDVLELMVAGDPAWRDLAHPQTVELYDRYRFPDLVRQIHTDPTVGSEGDLTETRDYATYTAAFDDASDRKWEQVAPFVVPGTVVDLGCAAGGLLERAARDPRLAESDLYGVDVSRHLVAEAEHRKAQGVFANPNIWFAQRNLLRAPVFPDASVSTTTTVALTHEIASYGAGRVDLEALAARIHAHTSPGGVWINSDVLGPDDPERPVVLEFADGLGAAEREPVDLDGWDAERVRAHVEGLSPAGRLVQFAHDFPRLSGGRCEVEWERGSAGVVGDGVGEPGVRAHLTLRAAMEYLYTRDYTDNWLSECHERFCDLTWADWVELVTAAGFEVDPASGPWRNEWLVENRLGVGTVLRDDDGARVLPWPSTHVLMVARRPL